MDGDIMRDTKIQKLSLNFESMDEVKTGRIIEFYQFLCKLKEIGIKFSQEIFNKNNYEFAKFISILYVEATPHTENFYTYQILLNSLLSISKSSFSGQKDSSCNNKTRKLWCYLLESSNAYPEEIQQKLSESDTFKGIFNASASQTDTLSFEYEDIIYALILFNDAPNGQWDNAALKQNMDMYCPSELFITVSNITSLMTYSNSFYEKYEKFIESLEVAIIKGEDCGLKVSTINYNKQYLILDLYNDNNTNILLKESTDLENIEKFAPWASFTLHVLEALNQIFREKQLNFHFYDNKNYFYDIPVKKIISSIFYMNNLTEDISSNTNNAIGSEASIVKKLFSYFPFVLYSIYVNYFYISDKKFFYNYIHRNYSPEHSSRTKKKYLHFLHDLLKIYSVPPNKPEDINNLEEYYETILNTASSEEPVLSDYDWDYQYKCCIASNQYYSDNFDHFFLFTTCLIVCAYYEKELPSLEIDYLNSLLFFLQVNSTRSVCCYDWLNLLYNASDSDLKTIFNKIFEKLLDTYIKLPGDSISPQETGKTTILQYSLFDINIKDCFLINLYETTKSNYIKFLRLPFDSRELCEEEWKKLLKEFFPVGETIVPDLSIEKLLKKKDLSIADKETILTTLHYINEFIDFKKLFLF